MVATRAAFEFRARTGSAGPPVVSERALRRRTPIASMLRQAQYRQAQLRR
jgi:hypothetical protein